MSFQIFYQVCKYPHEQLKNKYLVRKFIFDQDTSKFLKNENYVYGERNLNKLNKEIIHNGYSYESVHSSSFENIPYPNLK